MLKHILVKQRLNTTKEKLQTVNGILWTFKKAEEGEISGKDNNDSQPLKK